jgi:O-antigen ligase
MKGIIFTYALTAFGTFGGLRSPLIGLAVYICFATLRPQYMWGWDHRFWRISWIVAIAMLASWAMRGFGSWQFERGRGVVAAYLFYAFWAVVCALQAANLDVGWNFVDNLSKVVLPFLVGATLLRSHEWVRRMFWVILLSGAYPAYHLNLVYVQGVNEAQKYGYGGMDNNSIAIALVTVLGPALAVALYWPNRRIRLGATIASAMILHAVLLTFSRGGMVGLLALGITLLLIIRKHPKYLALAIVFVLLAVRLTGPELMARYESAFAPETELDASAASRYQLWRDCLSVAMSNPLFGVGPDHWPLIAHEFGWPRFKEAHSIWAQGAAELGFPGVLALFLFFAIAIVRLWPVARSRGQEPAERERAAMATGLILGTVGYSVSAHFVSLEGLEVPYYAVMTGVGLLASLPAPASVLAPAAAPAQAAAGLVPQPMLARARRMRPGEVRS